MNTGFYKQGSRHLKFLSVPRRSMYVLSNTALQEVNVLRARENSPDASSPTEETVAGSSEHELRADWLKVCNSSGSDDTHDARRKSRWIQSP